ANHQSRTTAVVDQSRRQVDPHSPTDDDPVEMRLPRQHAVRAVVRYRVVYLREGRTAMPRTQPRTPQVRGDAKRGEIMQAALSAFLDHGYLGTSVDEIAAVAHASKRTVYSHFGDKEALFREVIRSTIA